MMTLILAIVLFLLGAIFLFALVNPYYRERHLYIYLDFRNRFFVSAFKFLMLLFVGLAFMGAGYYALDMTINSGFFK